MGFVLLLLWLIFLSSWRLFQDYKREKKKKKEKEKVGRSFPPSFVLLHIIAENNDEWTMGGEERKLFLCFSNVSFQFETKLNMHLCFFIN